MHSVIDDLINENITVKIKTTTTTEKPKSAVEIYLELLQNMIKPTKEALVLPESLSDPVDIGVFAAGNEEGNIDYSDYHYEEFLSNQAVLNHFNEEDLLIGDSFETEGNINLMLETEGDHIVQDTTPRATKMFNSAFPELYRDLIISDKMSDQEGNEEAFTSNFKNKLVEKRVRKRRKQSNGPDDTKDVSAESTTTTRAEEPPPSATSETPSITFLQPLKPKFVDDDSDLDKDLLIMTSSGSLYGKKSFSSTG